MTQSILNVSGKSGDAQEPPSIARSLSSFSLTQSRIVDQIQALFTTVDDFQSENRSTLASLTNEIRSMFGRYDLLVEQLISSHTMERQLLLNLLAQQTAAQQQQQRAAPVPATPVTNPAMQVYNNAATPNSFFGANEQQQQHQQIMALQQAALMRQLGALTVADQTRGPPPVNTAAALLQTPVAPPAVPAATVVPAPVAVPAVVPSAPVVQPPPPAPPAATAAPTPAISFIKPSTQQPSFGSPSSAASSLFGGTASSTSAASSTVTGASTITAPTTAAKPFSFIAPTFSPATTVKTEVKEEEEDDDHVEEYEPDVHFAPVIPLPEIVATVTGEEGEKVLLEDRCKVYRFTDGQWKERATGVIKVLLNEKESKHRVVMRRDQMALVPREDHYDVQVHKVACNFPIVANLKVSLMPSNAKAVMWHCVDFSDDGEEPNVDGKHEQLSARFKSPEKADAFLKLVNDIASKKTSSPTKKTSEKDDEGSSTSSVTTVKAAPPRVTTPTPVPAPAPAAVTSTTPTSTTSSILFKPVVPAPSATTVVDSKVTSTSTTTDVKVQPAQGGGFGDKFKPKPGSWDCSACYTNCTAAQSECPCCGTAKDGSTPQAATDPFTTKALNFALSAAAATTTTPKFSFGFGAGTAAPAAPKSSPTAAATAAAAVTPVPATTTTTAVKTEPTSKASFAQAAAQAAKAAEEKEKKSLFGSSTTAAVAPTVVAPASTVSFSFKSAAGAAGGSTAAAAPLSSTTPTFGTFKTPEPGKSIFGGTSSAKASLFGASSPTNAAASTTTTTPSAPPKEEEKKETPSSIFGGSFMKPGGATGFSAFSAVGGSAGKSSIFGGGQLGGGDSGSAPPAENRFANLAKSKPFGSTSSTTTTTTSLDATKKNADEDGDDEGNNNPEEYEPNTEFAPVIPLPDLVEVTTGEEDEQVKFTSRAKIYRFARDVNEYKERGTGDLKLLYNPQTHKYRVVMRRDQVHKICANFPVQAPMKCNDRPNQPNVLGIVVKDFSENPAGELETFCVKFKNADIATNFRKAFEEAVKV